VKRYEKIHWVLWHPHQKLWNWRLQRGLESLPGIGRYLARLVIFLDTLVLAARAVAHRARALGIARIVGPAALPPRALYVDCGTHREGRQVRLVHDWFADRLDLQIVAFEASPAYHASVTQNLADLMNVRIEQAAVVGPTYADATVRLYRSGGDGKADSLFAERGTAYDDVPAVRLSQAIRKYVDQGVPVLLRMNIEGAELFVVEDLIEAGLLPAIAGYFGMWDDLSKIDTSRDDAFRRLLRNHGIHPFTFNDRDLDVPLRARVIRYEMATALAARRR
jgi:FkbM family methyltransferase